MATITLVANTNYSALTVADGDTIALAGYTLTFDVNPAQINVAVTAAGNAGKVVLGTPNSYAFTGWTFLAGTGVLLEPAAGNKTAGGSWTGGSASGAHAIGNMIATNIVNVTGSVTGGSTSGAYGVNFNYGTISGSVTGGAVSGAYGVSSNYGAISGSVTGGSTSGAYGVNANYGAISGSVTGGSTSGAYGVNFNYGTIASVTGVFTDAAGRAFGAVSLSPTWIVTGANLRCVVPAGVAVIYHIGAISALATINGSPTLTAIGGGTVDVFRGGLIR